MITFIQKLQSKSEEARKQILVGSLITSMAIVMLVWVYSLGGLFSASSAPQVASADTNEVSPFTLLKNSMKDTYQNISASVGKFSSQKVESQAEQKQIDLIPVEHTSN